MMLENIILLTLRDSMNGNIRVKRINIETLRQSDLNTSRNFLTVTIHSEHIHTLLAQTLPFHFHSYR